MKKPSILKTLAQKQMLITLLMGFSSGLPFLLTLRTLQAWMTEAGVDLKTIGFFSLASLPYTLKFLWAPFMDRFSIDRVGRRRTWLLITQSGLVLSLAIMAFVDPKIELGLMAFMALTVSFFSASQDIVIDAYRRESVKDEELGMAATFYLYGYRSACWISGAVALSLAQFTSWKNVYLIMAAIMAAGIAVTLWAPEPKVEGLPPRTLKETVVDPFVEFLSRPGALIILTFIILYKVGDNMAGNMLTPFYLKMGYSKLEIAAVAKTFSIFSTLIGSFIGGVAIIRFGIRKSLWLFGFLQIFSTFAISFLSLCDHNLWALGGVICFEDLATSMATAAFFAFMASLTNKRFTATQYALLSGIMSIPRTFVGSSAGLLAENLGWFNFFAFCALIAIPGMLMINKVTRNLNPDLK